MYEIFIRVLAERGLTTADVCRATGISQSTLSNWKKRKNILSPSLLGKIADYLGLSLDYLMGKTTDPFVKIDGLPNYMFNAATGTLIPTKDNSSIVQSAEKMPIESIFDKQDILNFSDEAKQVAIGYDSAPDNVKKAIQALLESQKPGL